MSHSRPREVYPFPAIEEAVVNAVYHRSYEQREPVEVRMNPGRIGGFLKELELTEGQVRRLVVRRVIAHPAHKHWV